MFRARHKKWAQLLLFAKINPIYLWSRSLTTYAVGQRLIKLHQSLYTPSTQILEFLKLVPTITPFFGANHWQVQAAPGLEEPRNQSQGWHEILSSLKFEQHQGQIDCNVNGTPPTSTTTCVRKENLEKSWKSTQFLLASECQKATRLSDSIQAGILTFVLAMKPTLPVENCFGTACIDGNSESFLSA